MKCRVIDNSNNKLKMFQINEIAVLLLWKDHPIYSEKSSRQKDTLTICPQKLQQGGNFLTREQFKDLLRNNYIELIYED